MSYTGFEYSNNNYGGGDGGYMESPTNGGGFSPNGGMSQQEAPAKSKFGDRSQRPVTIKMLKEATQDSNNDFIIDGKAINMVTLVGCVYDVKVQSTTVTLQLEDGTGRMEMRKWIDAEADREMSEKLVSQLREGAYVRVAGNLRSYQDSLSVHVFHVRPLEDMNELTAHMLEVVYSHLRLTRGPLQGGRPVGAHQPQGGMGMSMGMGMGMGLGQMRSPVGMQGGMHGGMQGGMGMMGGMSVGMGGGHGMQGGDGMGSLANVVLEALNSGEVGNEESGASVAQLMRHLRARNVGERELRQALEELVGEGHCYSTIDGDHYKSSG